MKNILRAGSMIVLIIVCALQIQAQQKVKMQLGYSINQPVGQFKDLITNTSYRGFNGSITYDVTEQLAVGLGVSFADFYQKYPRQVYKTDEGSISAVLSNSVQVMPIVAKADYSFLKEGAIRPYAGIGAGINMVNFDQYLGEFPTSKVTVKPALTGSAGIKVPLGATKTAGLDLGAHYNYLPFNFSGYQNLNSWGAHLGLYFPLK